MDWLGDNLWSAWLAAAALLAVGEMFSLDLVLVMLAVGAVAGMAVAIIGTSVLAASGIIDWRNRTPSSATSFIFSAMRSSF